MQSFPVVVGVDGSRNHLATVDIGLAEAVRRNAPLLIVHVWPGRAFRRRSPMPTEADGQRLLDVAARRAEHNAPNVEIATDLVEGSASAALARRSAAAQLLVVGHRDELPARPSWGSTAAYLAHHSACPLLVHRGAAPERGPVVLAASAREGTSATVACAYEEAARSDSRLVAVHVWTHPTGRNASSPIAVSSGYAADRREAERRLAEVLAGWAWSYPDLVVERLVLHDLDVAYTLERASRRGRLLVAGMAHSGRFAELLYGSLGASLLSRAACPVLLVPHGWRRPRVPTPVQGPAVATDPR
jgi:nucleotide-binding universal stress UspA family protein